ncbi:MAG: hypothetical protein OXU31_07990 [Gammaproteobacteria bacterium]|nr:hypothetical protein [Gammaproteobacteria bacterium]MDD9851934.1 hypothetical protein [Gammaproteobacteria bacterium]
MDVHPWNRGLWTMLLREWQRLPHALLFYGPRGMGRTALAMAAARRCLAGEAGAEQGGDGTLFDAATHPDFHLLTTEEAAAAAGEESLFARYAARYLEERKGKTPKSGPRTVITVHAVRELIDDLVTRPGIAAWRAVLVAPAEAMNANAANALLKVLEEPPPETLFLLTAGNLSRIPATIRSRCMLLPLSPPPPAEARAWLAREAGDGAGEAKAADELLALAGGAPLRAAELHGSGFAAFHRQLQHDVERLWGGQGGGAFAAQWPAQGPPAVVAAMQQIVVRRIRQILTHGGGGTARLFALYDHLSGVRRVYDNVLDAQLLLEELAMAVEAAGRPGGRVTVSKLETLPNR